MKISEVIKMLDEAKAKYGDVEVTTYNDEASTDDVAAYSYDEFKYCDGTVKKMITLW